MGLGLESVSVWYCSSRYFVVLLALLSVSYLNKQDAQDYSALHNLGNDLVLFLSQNQVRQLASLPVLLPDLIPRPPDHIDISHSVLPPHLLLVQLLLLQLLPQPERTLSTNFTLWATLLMLHLLCNNFLQARLLVRLADLPPRLLLRAGVGVAELLVQEDLDWLGV